MIALNVLVFVLIVGLTAYRMAVYVRQELERKRREAAARRFPTCSWTISGANKYTCFLSHYKVEAGAGARYMKDALGQMLGCPAYLDSSDLADLRELFKEGVHASEVIVLLLTDGLLTRPWCLLEIREAVRMQKPIVLLEMKGGQPFRYDAAFHMLSDLEANMPRLNPYCLNELRRHLGDMTLDEFASLVKRVLDEGLQSMGSNPLQVNINGTSNQLEAQLVDLVEHMAVVTGRPTVMWNGLGSSSPHKKPQKVSKGGWRKGWLGDHQRAKESADAAGVYLVHHPDASSHALRLKGAIEPVLDEECVRDIPSSDEDTRRCLERIATCKLLVVLQTKGVLAQPWTLLSIYQAYACEKPIVPVLVEGYGYDFMGACKELSQLETSLDAETQARMTAVLAGLTLPAEVHTHAVHGREGERASVQSLQQTLSGLVPNLISVVYDPTGSANELAATARDVRDKMVALIANIATKRPTTSSTTKIKEIKVEITTQREHAAAAKLQAAHRGKSGRLATAVEKDARALKPDWELRFVVESAGRLGIGLVARVSDGTVVISSVDEGTAAAEQGVRKGAVVREVNGASCAGLDKAAVMGMIKAAGRPLEIVLGSAQRAAASPPELATASAPSPTVAAARSLLRSTFAYSSSRSEPNEATLERASGALRT